MTNSDLQPDDNNRVTRVPLTAGELTVLLKAKADAERLMGSAGAKKGLQQAREEVASLLRTVVVGKGGKTVKRDIPHEPGCWMRFRPLTKTKLEEAEAEVESHSNYDLLDGLPILPDSSLDGYDTGVLCRLGIVGWGGPGYDRPFSPKLIDQLDPVTYEWAARHVLDISVPRQGDTTLIENEITHMRSVHKQYGVLAGRQQAVFHLSRHLEKRLGRVLTDVEVVQAVRRVADTERFSKMQRGWLRGDRKEGNRRLKRLDCVFCL